MKPIPPKILKVAREFLGLTQDNVEGASGISRKTIQRAELGEPVEVAYVYMMQMFYMNQGIKFVEPTGDDGWGVFNSNTRTDPNRLNAMEKVPPGKRQIGKVT